MHQGNMKINKESFFLVIYIIFLALNIINISFFARYLLQINNMFNYACMLFLLIYEISINKSVTMPSLIALLLLSVSSTVIYLRTPSFFAIMIIFTFTYVGRNIKFEKIAKVTYSVSFICLIIIVSCSYLGIIRNYEHIASGRKYIGFLYALYAPAILYNSVTNYVYCHRQKLKLKLLILFVAVDIFFYIETGSRLSCFSTLAVIIVSIFVIRNQNFLIKHRKVLLLFIPIYIMCSTVSIYLVASYHNNIEWMYNLNEILGKRISLAQTSILRYGVSFWGKPVQWNGGGLNVYGKMSSFNEYMYVDNLYMRILQQYGLIFFLLYIGLHTIVLIKCYQKREYLLMVIFIILAFHGLIDDLVLFLHSNSFWLAIGSIVFSNKFSINTQSKKIRWSA